jgi:predicted Holliday junction resolvase-like endonuclease
MKDNYDWIAGWVILLLVAYALYKAIKQRRAERAAAGQRLHLLPGPETRTLLMNSKRPSRRRHGAARLPAWLRPIELVTLLTEHIVPYLPGFDLDPKDIRFLGTPIDLIASKGLSEFSRRYRDRFHRGQNRRVSPLGA